MENLLLFIRKCDGKINVRYKEIGRKIYSFLISNCDAIFLVRYKEM